MTTFQTVTLVAVFCLALLTFIIAAVGLIKYRARPRAGWHLASQLLLFQTVLLLGVLQQSWLVLLIGLLDDLILAAQLIVKDARS
ncbi:MAG: hypothetical protein LKJ69_07370 [Lactobacillus sp.]|nr:hypothetical protein [Lactobacillus sp.]MCI2033211.1 hypothetical protein [Lactobacillus sp.]